MNDIAIDIQDLSKVIGDQSVLSCVNIKIPRGTIFGYLGPNGAGKTTTLRILLGLLQPTSGSVRLFGQHPKDLHNARRIRTGVVLENQGLYNQLTAKQNLDFYGQIHKINSSNRKTLIEKTLREFDLWEVQDTKVGAYSKGMKQRLALARSLLHNPEILFLDEPTSGLDPEAKAMIRSLLLKLSNSKQCTIFMSTHNLDEVERICTKIAILKRGVILAQGNTRDLNNRLSQTMIKFSMDNDRELRTIYPLLDSLNYIVNYTAINKTIIVLLKGARHKPDFLNLLMRANCLMNDSQQLDYSLEDIYLSFVQETEKHVTRSIDNHP